MSNLLYVGNLNQNTTEAELIEFFSDYGMVLSVRIKRNSLTGEPWGYGFVEMEDDTVAEEILSNAEGKQFGAQTLEIISMQQT